MADDNKFDINEFNEQMRRNQEAANFWANQDQAESLRKLSGRDQEGMSTKQSLILLAGSIVVGLFLAWLYFQFD